MDRHHPTRRQLLQWTGAGAAAGMVAVPGPVFGQSANNIKIIHSSSAVLLLWSVTYLAEALGYYKEEGLNVERIITPNGPAGMTALVTGAGHSQLSSPGEMMTAIHRGRKFKVLMSQSNFNQLTIFVSKEFAARHGVTSDSPLDKRLAALKAGKGMRAGVTSPGSMTDGVTRLAFRQVGLDPTRDVSIVPIGSSANAFPALANNSIEAYCGSSPNPEMAVKELNAVLLLNVGRGEIKGAKVLQGQVIEIRSEDVDRYADILQRQVTADVRAMRYIVDNPEKAGEVLYNSHFKQYDAKLWPTIWQNNIELFRTPFISRESMESWIENGLVAGDPNPKTFPYDDVIDMRFVEAAVKKIGWKVAA